MHPYCMKKLLFGLVVLAVLLAIVATIFLVPMFITDTEYAPNYSERSFLGIQAGATREEVIAALGEPLSSFEKEPTERWLYCDASHPGYAESGGVAGTFTEFTFDANGTVTYVNAQRETQNSGGLLGASFTTVWGEGYLTLAEGEMKSLVGTDRAEIEKRFGKPRHLGGSQATEVLVYSRSPSSTHYLVRRIGIGASGEVVEKQSYFWWD